MDGTVCALLTGVCVEGEECAMVGCGNLTFDQLTRGTVNGLYDLIIHAGDIACSTV